MTETHSVKLTDEELICLDGKCREEIQQDVNQSKKRLESVKNMPEAEEHIAKFVADIVTEVQTNGKLIFRNNSIRFCQLCGTAADYARYTRNGRSHSKGDRNYDKPLYLAGVELAYRFVRMKGYSTLGCCNECFDKVQLLLPDVLADVKAEIPKILTGRDTQWIKSDNVVCTVCKWEGCEQDMGELPTILGGGTYRGKCPKCEAANNFGITMIEVRDGYTLVPAETEKDHSNGK